MLKNSMKIRCRHCNTANCACDDYDGNAEHKYEDGDDDHEYDDGYIYATGISVLEPNSHFAQMYIQNIQH
jgi:hypothetical protein